MLKEDLITFMDMIQKFKVMGHHFSWVASHFVNLNFFLNPHTYSRNVVGEYYVHRYFILVSVRTIMKRKWEKKEKLRLLAFFQKKKKRPDRAIEIQSQWIHEWVLQFQFNILHSTYV